MSEEIRAKLFRNAMNGYNKNDVTEYIEKMNIEFQAEKLRLQTALIDAEKVIAEKNALEEKQKELLAEIEDLKKQCDDANAESESLKSANADKEQLIAAQNDALDKLCCEVEDLKNKSAGERIGTELSEKARLYDTMSSQIGDILINANKNAEDIIATARAKAEKIEKDAEEKANESDANIRSQAKSLSDTLLSQIKDSYAEYYAFQKAKINVEKTKCEELLKLIESDKNELDALAEEKHDSLSALIENASVN